MDFQHGPQVESLCLDQHFEREDFSLNICWCVSRTKSLAQEKKGQDIKTQLWSHQHHSFLQGNGQGEGRTDFDFRQQFYKAPKGVSWHEGPPPRASVSSSVTASLNTSLLCFLQGGCGTGQNKQGSECTRAKMQMRAPRLPLIYSSWGETSLLQPPTLRAAPCTTGGGDVFLHSLAPTGC